MSGPTNSQARLRLFGQAESDVRVTLYRDNHAWCPYCQKVWLWLEEKRIPYRIEKITMFCYGEKEQWYKEKVPSGMLPAVEIDGQLVTESDVVLMELERAFGSIYLPMCDKQVVALRKLERALFSAWCAWLCYPSSGPAEEKSNASSFDAVVALRTLPRDPQRWIVEECEDFAASELRITVREDVEELTQDGLFVAEGTARPVARFDLVVRPAGSDAYGEPVRVRRRRRRRRSMSASEWSEENWM